MKTLTILAVSLLYLIPAHSETPRVENVRTKSTADEPTMSNASANQESGAARRVHIYYDLFNPGGGTATISVAISNNGGASYSISPQTLSGDVGKGIAAGTNKHIVWDAMADLPGVYGTNYRARITATADQSTPNTITINIPNLPPGAKPLEMALIPPGSFQMGSNDPGWSSSSELPVHTVNIAYDFYMGKYEVTQAQWTALMGSEPESIYGAGDDRPVDSVTWSESQIFITALNSLGQGNFRLPSEAEWEYACRASTTTRFHFGDSNCFTTLCTTCDLGDYEWFCGNNSPWGTKAVGQLIPNAFSLHDMHGNVMEWCEDDWHQSYGETGRPDNGNSWMDNPRSTVRAIRGGYFGTTPEYFRSSSRFGVDATQARGPYGFRVVRAR